MRRFITAAMVVLAACGSKDNAPRDTVATVVEAPKAAAAGASDCPRTGHWSACQVKKRLEQSGLAPRDTSGLADLPSLGVPPATLMLGNAGLAYYVFSDTSARHRAAVTLDTLKYITQSKALSMRHEGTLIQNDNVLAILLSKNEHQRERVNDAITAGPPQP